MVNCLHIVPTYRPAWRYGGPIYSVHGLCKAIAQQNNNVSVYTTNVDGDNNMDVPLCQENNIDGVGVWYYPVTWPRRLYRSPEMKRALQETISQYDILHLHSVFLWPVWMAASIAKRAKIPYIVSPRGMLVADLIRAKSSLKKRLSIHYFDKPTLETAAAVHFTSHIEQQECEALGICPRKKFVIENGIDIDTEEIKSSLGRPKKDYVLYLGRINWKKGIDLLIEAVASIPGVQLVVAGNDEEGYLDYLKETASRMGVRDRVDFIGEVKGREKWKLLSEAAILVLPSLSENFGNVALEAMLVGTPVVVTEGVGISDIVRRARSGIVSEAIPWKIANAIKRINGSPDLAREFAEAGRRVVVREYSWSRIAHRMMAEYKEIVNG